MFTRRKSQFSGHSNNLFDNINLIGNVNSNKYFESGKSNTVLKIKLGAVKYYRQVAPIK